MGNEPLSSMSKVGERTKGVDPVVIDRGSGHNASTTFPASSVASTSNAFRENIEEERVVITAWGTTEVYMHADFGVPPF